MKSTFVVWNVEKQKQKKKTRPNQYLFRRNCLFTKIERFIWFKRHFSQRERALKLLFLLLTYCLAVPNAANDVSVVCFCCFFFRCCCYHCQSAFIIHTVTVSSYDAGKIIRCTSVSAVSVLWLFITVVAAVLLMLLFYISICKLSH